MILVIFDLSFVLRAVYNEIYVALNLDDTVGYITSILSGSIFDCMPISLILYYHMKNFKAIKPVEAEKQNQEDTIDEDEPVFKVIVDRFLEAEMFVEGEETMLITSCVA